MNFIIKSLPKIRVSFDRETNGTIDPIITESKQAYEILMSIWNPETIELFEEFKVLYLDRRNAVLGYRNLSRGTTSGTLVNIKLLVGIALECNAEGVIICHNHPSGNTAPSQGDIQMTRKVKNACELFDISLLDHIILTKNSYSSLSDNWIIGE